MPDPIEISTGLVQGTISEYDRSVIVYKGLPYAASTAGENRWRPPQPAPSWEGVRVAESYGPACPQIPFGPMNVLPSQSEDCLSLNIWAPTRSTEGLLPVFVWIYGGRFIAGSGSEPAYEGSGFASKGIVVVTFNYRVGILGFLATPELSEESGHNRSGNYGILDQIAALKWIRENITAFGGDPSKVTIGGQSAGGASTAIHMLSPLSQGLFRAAIPQSGWRHPRDPLLSCLAPAYRTKQKAESQGVMTMKAKGASTMAEMRTMGLDELLEGNNKNDEVWGSPPFYRPCVDGRVLPHNYEESLNRGLVADIPVLTGHNADEGGTYADPAFNEDDFRSCARQKYGSLAPKFLELYPVSADVNAREAWNQAAGDNSRITTALWAEEYHKHAKHPVYGYFYTHAPPARKGGPEPPPARQAVGAPDPDGRPMLRRHEKDVSRSEYTYNKMGPDGRSGAFHGAEIPYVLTNLYAQEEYPYGDDDHEVARILSAYWSNFVKNGDPNGQELPTFIPVDNARIMSLGLEPSPVPLAATPARAAFWREYLQAQPSW